jgi:hypothetical protein
MEPDRLAAIKFAFARSCDAVNLLTDGRSLREALPEVWFRAIRHLDRLVHVPAQAFEEFEFLSAVMDNWIVVDPTQGLILLAEVTDEQTRLAKAAVEAICEAILAAFETAAEAFERAAETLPSDAEIASWFLWYPYGAYPKEDPTIRRLREWNPPAEARSN